MHRQLRFTPNDYHTDNIHAVTDNTADFLVFYIRLNFFLTDILQKVWGKPDGTDLFRRRA